MSEPTKAQLEALAAQINARLAEFATDAIPAVTVGIVRVAHEIITAYLRNPEQVVAPVARPSLPNPDIARDKLADALATGSAGNLVQAMASAADDDEVGEYETIMAELKRLSMAGVMPGRTTWDGARPAHLPNSQAIIKRYKTSWTQMAQEAGLRIDRGQNMPPAEPVYANGHGRH